MVLKGKKGKKKDNINRRIPDKRESIKGKKERLFYRIERLP